MFRWTIDNRVEVIESPFEVKRENCKKKKHAFREIDSSIQGNNVTTLPKM